MVPPNMRPRGSCRVSYTRPAFTKHTDDVFVGSSLVGDDPLAASRGQMIKEALVALKERTGSSQYAIAKHMEEQQKVPLPPNFRKLLSVQIKKLVAGGKLVKIKNSFRLPKKSVDVELIKTKEVVAVKKVEALKNVVAVKKASNGTPLKKVKAKVVAVAKVKEEVLTKKVKTVKKAVEKLKKPKSIKSPVKKPKNIKSPVKKLKRVNPPRKRNVAAEEHVAKKVKK